MSSKQQKHKILTFTGNNAWLKLKALSKKPSDKKIKKRKRSKTDPDLNNKKAKITNSQSLPENMESFGKDKLIDDNNVNNDSMIDPESKEANQKIQSSSELMSLLASSKSRAYNKNDCSQWDDDSMKIEDVQQAFGHEAAYSYWLGVITDYISSKYQNFHIFFKHVS